MNVLRFEVLGPLRVVTDDGSPVRVAEPKVRALLADLLAHGGGPVPADRLIDDLWGARPGRNPTGTLQARVSQLRRSLGGSGTVVLGPAGYRLAAGDSDAARFAALVARRSGDPAARAAELEEALALWRGPAYAEFADEGFARAEAARLEELRLTALEEQAELRLTLGEPVDLGDLVVRHPLRERLVAAHMTALYRGGRQSEALAAYGELRGRLEEELGLDPSPRLAALHQAILRQEPGLGGAPRTNLPAPLTELIGREADVAAVGSLLTTSRLVTLTGPGGVGKTRLALAAAATGAAPADGVWLVELSGAADPAEALAAVLGVRDDAVAPLSDRGDGPAPLADVRGGHGDAVASLGRRGDATASLRVGGGVAGAMVERLAEVLSGKRVLVVLDNCEHLVEAVAGLVSRLLRAAPGLRVLATGQEPLGVTGERVRVVEPLPEADAVRLFTARADVPADETVAAVCRRLDGIPLALELAATRVRALGVRELAARLDDRFRLLSAGMRDAPARQRTLRAMIDWSWELLGDAERVVLRRLAVHADGCTLEAAEEVCAEPGVDVLDTLARLVDRSLVVRVEGPRYRLLESVAAYCVERLREAGEHDRIRERHARYYTALAARADLRGPGQREWLARLDAESANLRLALAGPDALRLVNALAWYWILRGRLNEGRRSLTAALRAASSVAGEGEVARASVWLAGMELLIGGSASPVRWDGLDAAGVALADWLLSHVRWAYGDHRAHEEAADRALVAFEALGDRWGVAAALCLRAKLAVGRADLAAMERDGRRGLALFEELGDAWGRIEAMDVLDRAAEIRGDYAEALRLREEGLRLAEELGFEVSFKLAGLGRIALLAGDYTRADDYHERARALAVAQSYKPAEENAVLGLAMSARRQARDEEAEAYLLPVLDWLRGVEGTPGVAFIMAELGFAAEQRGAGAAALSRHREGYAAARVTGDPRAIALALEGLAGALSLPLERPTTERCTAEGCAAERCTAREQEQELEVEAAGLLGAATAIRRAAGTPLPSGERLDVDRILGRLRAALGDEALARALASGEGELGDHFPGALGGRARVEPAAQCLHPLAHPDQPEPAAEPGHPRVRAGAEVPHA
ncbi:BTAD domain-containing putative transcriptional regulator [Nonomuraea fuscirosea]|uniref:BTAD domain-containing putative transcriptional regulator n=1 Tax=Nonomuraea fuscirosea TaxID=1291556 RepID=UPI0033EDCE8B